MPTKLRRHTLTETADLAAAIDTAARKWPDESRTQLLARLARERGEQLRLEDEERLERKRRAWEEAAGMFDGVYLPNELEVLRRDWPE